MIGGRVGGRERRAEVQRLGDVHDPTQGAPVAETTPMAESMHRYAPKPLCLVHLLRSPLGARLGVAVDTTLLRCRQQRCRETPMGYRRP